MGLAQSFDDALAGDIAEAYGGDGPGDDRQEEQAEEDGPEGEVTSDEEGEPAEALDDEPGEGETCGEYNDGGEGDIDQPFGDEHMKQLTGRHADALEHGQFTAAGEDGGDHGIDKIEDADQSQDQP